MSSMNLSTLQALYAGKVLTPRQLLSSLRELAAQYADHNIWIHLLSDEELEPYLDALDEMDPATHPLWGIPFAIKDNIDLAGIPTTAACEAFTYVPSRSAAVVERLIGAGAIPVGKTNLDQFATGLNGTRSPWGACRNAFDPDYISGGSSSGSAVAVALGLVSFSLGTDTAGSGRVPAAFNNLVGVKPTRGLISTQGVVPACRSLDCVSIFALDTDDAAQVLRCAEGCEGTDPYGRHNPFHNSHRHYGLRSGRVRVGVLAPEQLQFFGDSAYAAAYEEGLERLRALGLVLQEIDFTPFLEAARLLYEGPWVSERYLVLESLLRTRPEAVLPVIRDIVQPGGGLRASDLFEAQYRLQALKQECQQQLSEVDCLLTPTAGRLFTRAELAQEPVAHNTALGYYTNFMNLLDMSAVALPLGFTAAGLPFGVTLAAAAFQDRALLSIARRIQQALNLPRGATQQVPLPMQALAKVGDLTHVELLVCGAHLSGQPLNWQLTERGAQLLQATVTAPEYRFYELPGKPLRPALKHDSEQGRAIEVEVWSMPVVELGGFVAAIPAPLGIGQVKLADGRWVCGFICEAGGLQGAREIVEQNGWRAWLEQVQ